MDYVAVGLGAVALVAVTMIIFALLVRWTAGGATPWSIVTGVADGIRDWAGRPRPQARTPSVPATEPPPPIDTSALPLAPLAAGPRGMTVWVEDLPSGTDPDAIEMEELPTRRV